MTASTKKERPRLGFGFYLALLLAAFLTWAGLFKLDESVRATGEIIPDGRTQIVQVADGGILKTLYVREGQQVKTGDIVAELERERAEAGVEAIRAQLASLEIAQLRAEAEALGQRPDFHAYTAEYPGTVAAQEALYEQNLRALDEQVASVREALEIAREEQRAIEELYRSGDISTLEMMRSRREVIDLEGRLVEFHNRYRTDARRECAEIEQDLAAMRFTLKERRDVLEHTRIYAPRDGIVTFLPVNTLGGVLRPGDELMHISPTTGENLLEVRVPPADIGHLAPNLPVTVRLGAFDYSIYGALEGQLVYLSADTLSERGPDGREMTYYRGSVVIPAEQENPRLSAALLRPGMTATADIRTGRRSVLAFIIKPISRAFSGALTQR